MRDRGKGLPSALIGTGCEAATRSVQAMWCPACSRVIADGSVRCSACGADFSQLPTRDVQPDSGLHPGRRLHFPPGAVFAGRFTIIDQVGGGGMGVVYKAIDETLHQEVALKLLRPEFASEFPYVERFKREVRVARQINHPNVCRVYDLGESEGLLYFSMEWVRGETLRDLLKRAGKLDEARALEIAEKVARALQAAHGHGIVHRDLKPGNVMIDDGGQVLVMDFGVAAESGESTLTGPLGVVGTPAYMSPEQQRPGGRVDGRSDLYSLGLVLEEMLTGELPPGRRHGGAPGRHDTTRAATAVLSGLVAEDPGKRFPSAAAAAEAISRVRARHFPAGPLARWRQALAAVPAAVWLLLVPATVLVWWLGGHPGIGGRPPVLSSAEAFFQRGRHYLREEAETLASIGNAVQMFHRSIQSDSTFARAWAGLGEAYWMHFERTKEGAPREEAERAVARAVALDASLAETRIAQARGLIAGGKHAEARGILIDLVNDEPNNDVAWASLGRACRGQEQYQQGLEALRRAIALRPASFRHHAELGAFLQRSGEYDQAEKEFRKAIELKPESPTAWINLGASYLHQGEPGKAIEALEQALRYEQRAATYSNLGTAYYYVGDYRRAEQSYRQAAARDTGNATFAGNLGDALRVQGRGSEAVTAYQEAVRRARAVLELAPEDLALRTELALLCARAGDSAAALSEAGQVTQAQPQDVRVLFMNAVIRAVLGRDEEALDWLARAVELGLGKAEIVNDPDLTRLKGHPRYKAILELAG